MKLFNRKGSSFDIIYILVLFFVFAILAFTGLKVGDAIFESPDMIDQLDDSSAGNATLETWDTVSDGGMDSMIIWFYFGLNIAALVLAGFIPIAGFAFIVLHILFALIILLLGSQLQNSLSTILSGFGLTMTKTSWVIDHLFGLEVMFIILMIVVFFLANRKQEGAGL